jgi:hypothetical protein
MTTKRRRPSRKARTKSSAAPHPHASPAVFTETPRLITPEEKHELIMAHAASRASHDPLQRITLWSGVMVALVAVLVGWWYTVGLRVRQTLEGGNGDLRGLTSELDRFRRRAEESRLIDVPDLPKPTNEAAAAEFGSLVERILNEDDASATRRDLLSPYPGESSAPTEGAAVPGTPNPFVDPDSPGLIQE